MNKFLKRLNKAQMEKGVQIQSGVSEVLKTVSAVPENASIWNRLTSWDFQDASESVAKARQNLNKLTHGDT